MPRRETTGGAPFAAEAFGISTVSLSSGAEKLKARGRQIMIARTIDILQGEKIVFSSPINPTFSTRK